MYEKFGWQRFISLGLTLFCMSNAPAQDIQMDANNIAENVKKERDENNVLEDKSRRLEALAVQYEKSGLIEAGLVCRALLVLMRESVNIKQRDLDRNRNIISILSGIYMMFLFDSAEMDKEERDNIIALTAVVETPNMVEQLKALVDLDILFENKNAESESMVKGDFKSRSTVINTVKEFKSKTEIGIMEPDNLAKQRASMHSVPIIEDKYKRNEAYYAVLEEFGEYFVELLNKRIIMYERKGQHEDAKKLSKSVNNIFLLKLKAEKGSQKGKEALFRFTGLEFKKEAADLAKSDDRESAKKFGEIAEFFQREATAPLPIGLMGSVATPGAQKKMVLAAKQAESGEFVQAEKNLEEACPTFHQRSLIDVSAKGMMDFLGEDATAAVNSKDNSFAECFAELALVRAQGSFGANVDQQAFAAAQNATITEAGAALANSTARKYLQTHGGGAMLEKVDAKSDAILKNAKGIFNEIKSGDLKNIKNGNGEAKQLENSTIQFLFEMAKEQIELDKLVNDLVDRFPEYFNLRAPKPIALSSLQAVGSNLLQNDEAIILWMNVPGERNGLVFAVSKTRAGWAKIKLTGNQISDRVTKLRQQVDPCSNKQTSENCSFVSLNFDLGASWELHQALLGAETIQNVIGDTKIKTLLIVPSGPLTTLPPALLITAQPKAAQVYNNSPEEWANAPWLIKTKAIAVLPSIAALQTLRAVLPKTKLSNANVAGTDRLFMLADPDFSGLGNTTGECMFGSRAAPKAIQAYFKGDAGKRAALANLTPLPCTRLEGEVLKQALGGSLLLGKAAREAQLRTPSNKKKLAQAEVVVFATHGLISGDLGLGEPALALAAPLSSESDDDGLLTASEVTELKLSAEWVVLSACNTASPDLRDANGLSGLSSAFFYAGAKSVLASHWRVHDATTKDLMIKTIGRKANVSKAQALRDASLALLERDDNKYSHPSFWAPFTLIGESR